METEELIREMMECLQEELEINGIDCNCTEDFICSACKTQIAINKAEKYLESKELVPCWM